MFRIEVAVKPAYPDARGEGLCRDIGDLGIAGVEKARVSDVYVLEGNVTDAELEAICRELLVDPVLAPLHIRLLGRCRNRRPHHLLFRDLLLHRHLSCSSV